MKFPSFDYLEPGSLAECGRLLKEGQGKALAVAGGTDLLPALKNRVKTAGLLVGLGRLPGISDIEYNQTDGLKLGGGVTLRRLVAHPAVKDRYPALAQAALAMGSTQLQAMGTVGGNLCQDACCLYYHRPPMWRRDLPPCFKLGGQVCHAVKSSDSCWATYSGDLAPALLSLGAKAIVSDGESEEARPLEQLFSGDGRRPNTLAPDLILTSVQIPPAPKNSGGTYLKLRQRQTIDYPLLGVAASVSLDDDLNLTSLRVGLTAVERKPLTVEYDPETSNGDIEQIKTDLADRAHQSARPIDNTSGYTPKYRRHMVRVFVAQAVGRAWAAATSQREK